MNTLLESILARVEVNENGCWIWTGVRNEWGYGRFTYKGKTRQAHRLSYEAHRGEIPEGLEIDHLCRVRACCNPDHLEPVTRAENMRRATPHLPTLKITDEQVSELRAMHAAGGISQRALGRHFGISATLVNFIVNDRRKQAA